MAYATGFYRAVKDSITPMEKELLPYSVTLSAHAHSLSLPRRPSNASTS